MSTSDKFSSGQVRRSQIVTTFGPGSMMDLPHHAVIVGGLEHWHFGSDRQRVWEDRLETRVAEILGVSEIRMYAPPVDEQDPGAPDTGITAFTFPIWFIAQYEEEISDGRSRPLVHWNGLHKRKFQAPDRKNYPVVPVRFVQACPNGHLSDIDWFSFVHEDFKSTCRGQLWLDETGTSGDLGDLRVRCEACKMRRSLALMKGGEMNTLGVCQGSRPWLGKAGRESCINHITGKPHHNRLLIRSASNAYFAQTLSVISIPDREQRLRDAVDLVFEDFLQYCESVDDVKRERKKEKVFHALQGFADDTVWKDVQRRKGKHPVRDRSIKQAEIETLLSTSSDDKLDEHFFATVRKLDALPDALKPLVERIVLVHRLREVTAQVGFTRFEAAMPDIDGELDINVRRAALSMDPMWAPATENRGEGVFIGFRVAAIDAWLKRPSVKERVRRLEDGFREWARGKGIPDPKFPGAPYIMLHSLSHLLLTAVALECGYSASSIRERVYAGSYGYGILLHTGTPGAEGTLGGLVEVGRRIERHLVTALEMGRLCSNDPVCAGHEADDQFEERFLHGAACHGCLLIAETSCERRNELLDRALVVPTVACSDAAFFQETEGAAWESTGVPIDDDAAEEARPLSVRDIPEFDAADFDEPWRPHLAALARLPGFSVELGGDVTSGGRVLGSYVASVGDGHVTLHVVDATDRNVKKAVDALRKEGRRAEAVDPSAPDVVATIERALKGS